jgi:hypothetical protein
VKELMKQFIYFSMSLPLTYSQSVTLDFSDD